MTQFLKRAHTSITWRIKEPLLKFAGLRSLLFYEWAANTQVSDPVWQSNTAVRVLDATSFRQLEWSGNPWVFTESCDFRGEGCRHAFAAFSSSNKLVGFCWLEVGLADMHFLGSVMQLPNSVGYLSRLWVDESARNAGVAGELIFSVQKNATQLGLNRIISACVLKNHKMQAIYKRTGWLQCGQIDRYFLALLSYYCIMPVNDRYHRTPFGKKILMNLIRPQATA